MTMTHDIPRRRSAFTLIELLVVISLLTILLAIAVPAFSGLLYSNERAMADSKLKIAATLGRDAAVRAGRGSDGAVAFFFDSGGRVRAVPFVKAGEITDLDDDGNPVVRDVFIKVDLFEAIELPKNWSVRGYTPPNTIDEQWYEDTYGTAAADQGNWVFPETAFYDNQDPDGGDRRQTFFIRYDAGSGTASVPKSRDALLLDPSPSRTLRTSGLFDTYNIERFGSHRAYVQQVLQLTSDAQKRTLLGDSSPDTVLARQVTQVTLYDEQRLASALKTRVDRTTGSLYKPGDVPELVASPVGSVIDEINRWIESPDSADVDPGDQKPEQDARVYFVERYSGSLREMYP